MARFLGLARLHAVCGFLALQLITSCDAGKEFTPPIAQVITEPIPPPRLFDNLAPNQRQIELQKLARGTPIGELPESERLGVAEANRREALRGSVRDAVRSFAVAQSARASEAASHAAKGEQ